MSSTARQLHDTDIVLFHRLCMRNPGKTVRVYSADGFVPRSYKWRCEIQYIYREKDGTVYKGWTGAQRAYGDGPHATVANRRARSG